MGNGNPYTLFLRENGCNLSGEKFNNINEDKNDLEVPLLGIYSMVMLGKNLPRHTFGGERVSLLLHSDVFSHVGGTSTTMRLWPFFAPSFTPPKRRWSDISDL